MRAFTAVTVLFAALFIWLTGQSMPAVVASSFDGTGAAQATMSRDGYLAWMVALAVVTPLLVAFSGSWIRALPNSLINLTNKDYWLAPERRAESLRAMATHLQAFGVLIAVFLCYVHWLVARANTAGAGRLDNTLMWFGLGAFLLATVVWIAALYRRFGRAPPTKIRRE